MKNEINIHTAAILIPDTDLVRLLNVPLFIS